MMINNSSFFLCTIVVCLLLNFSGLCQTADSVSVRKVNKIVYVEVVGNAPFMSLNFEYKITSIRNALLYFHTGIGYDRIDYNDSDVNVFSVPIEATFILFKGKHHLEYGFGITPFISKTATWSGDIIYYDSKVNENYSLYFLLIPEIGYRFQNLSKRKVFFKFGFTPVIFNSSVNNHFDFIPSIGIGIGKTF